MEKIVSFANLMLWKPELDEELRGLILPKVFTFEDLKP